LLITDKITDTLRQNPVWEPEPVALLFKKFTSFYGTRMFITGKKFPPGDSILGHLHGIHILTTAYNSKILIKTLLNANFSLTMPVLLSVRIKQLGSHWTVIHEILYWGF
jgi:hypothetical protein